MAKSKKPLFILKCKDCDYIPEEDKEKSNENWHVYDTKCPKCGKPLDMEFQ
jgi:Zn finger protein HypA/HybF involved in hydrogenase expression